MAHRRHHQLVLPTATIAYNIDCPPILRGALMRPGLRMGTVECQYQTGCSIMYPMEVRGIAGLCPWVLSMGREARQTQRVCFYITPERPREKTLIWLSLDTSHVPCKFFRSGQCQAGKACPFSHSTDISTVDTPCKYFAKVWSTFTAFALEGHTD